MVGVIPKIQGLLKLFEKKSNIFKKTCNKNNFSKSLLMLSKK